VIPGDKRGRVIQNKSPGPRVLQTRAWAFTFAYQPASGILCQQTAPAGGRSSALEPRDDADGEGSGVRYASALGGNGDGVKSDLGVSSGVDGYG